MEIELVEAAIGLIREYGYLAVFIFLFLETSMLFPLLPSEVVVPSAASVMITEPADILLFGGAAAGGGGTGGMVAYYLFGGGSNWVATRLDDRFVDDDDLEWARGAFSRYGESSVFWGRLLPVFRSLISIPAGLARMNRAKFVVYTGIGTFVYNASIAALVFYGRESSLYAFASAFATANPWLTAALLGSGVLLVVALWRAGVIQSAKTRLRHFFGPVK
jgi:membrane protein DedA with SNARE-associated domain